MQSSKIGNKDVRELTGYDKCIREEMKARLGEIKKSAQGTNSEEKETGTQNNNLEQEEEINIQLEQNVETRIQKNEGRLRNLRDNFKYSNT